MVREDFGQWGEIACWGNQTLDNIMRREYIDQIVLVVKWHEESEGYGQMKAYLHQFTRQIYTNVCGRVGEVQDIPMECWCRMWG